VQRDGAVVLSRLDRGLGEVVERGERVGMILSQPVTLEAQRFLEGLHGLREQRQTVIRHADGFQDHDPDSRSHLRSTTRLAERSEQDIGWLDVAVQHSPAVGVGDRVANVDEPPQELTQRGRSVPYRALFVEPPDGLAERTAARGVVPDEPHGVIRAAHRRNGPARRQGRFPDAPGHR
jgi:hypothetical protein